MVPPEVQIEVCRTVKLRSKDSVDATWAPWWRAQAQAIAHVAFATEPNAEARDKFLLREMKFADELEAR